MLLKLSIITFEPLHQLLDLIPSEGDVGHLLGDVVEFEPVVYKWSQGVVTAKGVRVGICQFEIGECAIFDCIIGRRVAPAAEPAERVWVGENGGVVEIGRV